MSTAVQRTTPDAVSNQLIQGLPRKDRLHLLQACDTVSINFGDVLCRRDEVYRQVYFPLTGFISLVTSLGRHPPLEMGMIGSEGMLGATLVLGVNSVPLHAVVQGTGTALRQSATQFRRQITNSPALERSLSRYLYVLLEQLSQTSACTRFHPVESRLARWLLMTHDRAHSDGFQLTHQYLADMLGVRRSGITVAAGVLQKNGLISYRRGDIRILDRRGLEAASCECYAAVVGAYAGVFGRPQMAHPG